MLRILTCAAGVATAVSLATAQGSGSNLRGWTNLTQAVAAEHGRKSYATCGWIGVRVTPMTAAVADSLGMAVSYGAIFATPRLGSPATKAGIEAGDVVTMVNGSPLEHARDFARLISMMAPGSSVSLNTMRNGQLIMVTPTLGSINCHSPLNADDSGSGDLPGRANNSAQVAAVQNGQGGYATCGWIGVRVAPMTEAFANSLNMAVPYGAIFAKPQPGSPAAKAGIQAGDVVTSVNNSPIAHARDFARLISTMAPGSFVSLSTIHDVNEANTVTLTVGSIKCHSLTVAEDSDSTHSPAQANSAQIAATQNGRKGYATCGWIGVRARGMTAAVPHGAILAKPQPGSPAAEAGIKAGDVVTAVDGSPLGHSRNFAQLISMLGPGSSTYLSTMRNGQARSVRLTVGSTKCKLHCTTNSVCLPGPVLQTR